MLCAQLSRDSRVTNPPNLLWGTKHEFGVQKGFEEVGRALNGKERIGVESEGRGECK